MSSVGSPIARTPLHHWHAAHGARFIDRDGWQIVARYGDPGREAEAVHGGLALVDVSAFAKRSLRGPRLPDIGPLGVIPMRPTQALACRLTEDHLLLVATALGKPLAGLGDGPGMVQTDVTSAFAGFWVLGPHAEELLRRLTHVDLRLPSFPVNTCAETTLAGVETLLVRTAEALHIYVAWDLGEYVWERLLQAGRDWQITPVGMDALE